MGLDSIRELDLESVECHTDHRHYFALDADPVLVLASGHGAGVDLLDVIGLLVEQVLDRRWGKLEYVGVSLLTVVGEETFDYLAE